MVYSFLPWFVIMFLGFSFPFHHPSHLYYYYGIFFHFYFVPLNFDFYCRATNTHLLMTMAFRNFHNYFNIFVLLSEEPFLFVVCFVIENVFN